jgi:hypothetical protein
MKHFGSRFSRNISDNDSKLLHHEIILANRLDSDSKKCFYNSYINENTLPKNVFITAI